MAKQRILSIIIGISQLALGAALLLVPNGFFSLFGFSAASADQNYLFGQLAARFLAYGIGMFAIAQDPQKHRLWWLLMALIQAIDLGVGLVYSAFFGVPWEVTAFPLFNALAFLVLLILWTPKPAQEAKA
jgi:hypothetical protein